jgi:toxin HigB-1
MARPLEQTHSRRPGSRHSSEQMNIPGLRFHLLRGRDKGRYSVWASGNWRITFGWSGEDAVDADLEDYH